MSDHVELLEAVRTGRRSVVEVATRLGLSVEEVERKVEVLALARALAHHDGAVRRRQLLRGAAVLVAVLAMGSVLSVRAAWAAGTCAQTLPSPLVTFCPDEPALASEVNANFNHVVTGLNGLVTKTGAASSPDVSTRNLTTSGSITTNTGALSFGAATRQMVNLYDANYGIGVQPATAYFRTGGNFSWFLGGVHANVTDDPGGGGSRLMQLNAAGNLTVTSINGRRPAYNVIQSCNAGSVHRDLCSRRRQIRPGFSRCQCQQQRRHQRELVVRQSHPVDGGLHRAGLLHADDQLRDLVALPRVLVAPTSKEVTRCFDSLGCHAFATSGWFSASKTVLQALTPHGFARPVIRSAAATVFAALEV